MKNIILILFVVCFSSCGVFKKSLKTKDIEKIESNVSIKKDSSSLTIDKSNIIIKEKIDTTVIIPEKIIISEKTISIDSILKGALDIKNDLVDVKFDYNEITGVLKTTTIVKPQKIPVKIDKITTINKDVTIKKQNKEAIVQTTDSTKKKVLLEKKPDYWLIIILGFLVSMIIVFWKWIKNNIIKKFFPLI